MTTQTLLRESLTLPGGEFDIYDLSHPMSETDTGHTAHKLGMEHGNFDYDGTAWIRMSIHSHAGSHMELPRNLRPDLTDAIQTPLTTGIGWMEILDLSDLPPEHVLTVEDLERAGLNRVKKGELAGIFSNPDATKTEAGDRRIRLSSVAMQAIADRGISAICMDNGTLAIEATPEECIKIHNIFLGHGIPIIENLYSLGQVPAERVFFIALALPVIDLDSSPVRALALVPKTAGK